MNTIKNQQRLSLIYLMFLRKNEKIDQKFYDELFYFILFHNRSFTENKLSKNFTIYDYEVKDGDKRRVLRLLKYHGFIDEEDRITSKGDAYFIDKFNQYDWLRRSFEHFGELYKGQSILEYEHFKGSSYGSFNPYYENTMKYNSLKGRDGG